MKDYFIGQGTGIVKEFNSLDEMSRFHEAMEPKDRHFCKLYDHKAMRYAPGWRVYGNYSDDSRWSRWS